MAMSLQLWKIAELRRILRFGGLDGGEGSTRVLFWNRLLWYRSAIVPGEV